MERIYADEFHPISELVTEEHTNILPPFPIIDAHAHFGPLLLGDNYESTFDTKQSCEWFEELDIEKLLCFELVWGDEYKRLCEKLAPSNGKILPVGSLDVFKALDKDFDTYVYNAVNELKASGSVALKLWKNMTLMGEKRFGKNLRLDDPHYAPIWKYAGEAKLPIVLHVADPPCFFKPTTPENEHYICLSQHPDWSFCRPGMFSFEEHMEMQENVIAQNPATTFVIAHICSYAENLSVVSKWLDKYPNLYTDIAARLDQLGRQPYSSFEFLNKYQDRVLFGTDYEGRFDKARTYEFYHTHYRFMQTRDEYFDHPFPDFLGQWKICGMGLDDSVLEKIYRTNAKKIFGI